MSKRPVNNLLGLAVLAYLSQGPMHPYELSRILRTNGDVRSIRFTHGSLYMVVGQLTRAGLIIEAGTDRAGLRPERTSYELTTAGRAELRSWMQDLVREPEHEYPHFVAALSLIGALSPGEVVELLRERLARLAEQRAECEAEIAAASDHGVHPLFLIEEEYRLAIVGAEVAFVERFIGQITDPETGWASDWERHRSERALPEGQS